MSVEQGRSQICREVLDKISKEEVKQTSSAIFLFQKMGVILLVAICAFLAIFLFSLALFNLRMSGLWFAGRLGVPALAPLLLGLPWIILLLVGGLALILEILLKKFEFGYKKPLIYSFVIVSVLVVLTGYVVERLRLHQYLFTQTERGEVPVVGRLYKRGEPVGPVFLGNVQSLAPQEFELQNRRGEVFKIYISDSTRLPREKTLMNGDFVLVLGVPESSGVVAKGVRLVPDEFLRQRYMQMAR